MALTIREQIIQAIATRAANLSTLPVERCQRSYGETDSIFVSVWDGALNKTDEKYGIETLRLDVAVELIWQPAGNASEDVNAMMAEVDTTIRGTDRTLGGLALKLDLSRIDPQYSDDGSRYVRLAAVYTITYQTPIADPYTVATI